MYSNCWSSHEQVYKTSDNCKFTFDSHPAPPPHFSVPCSRCPSLQSSSCDSKLAAIFGANTETQEWQQTLGADTPSGVVWIVRISHQFNGVSVRLWPRISCTVTTLHVCTLGSGCTGPSPSLANMVSSLPPVPVQCPVTGLGDQPDHNVMSLSSEKSS